MIDESEPVGSEGELRGQLTRLLEALEACGRAAGVTSGDALLQSIVDAAARLFGAAAASIALVEPDGLRFCVAHGAGQQAIVGQRIPLGQGIAGYVAMTGQPLSVSDVQRDPRFAAQFASGTGYVPRSILAVPLQAAGAGGSERTVGVMEVLDKLDAAAFGLRDIELLGLFARQAAFAIDQSRTMERLSVALVQGLRQALAEGGAGGADAAASAPALDELTRLAERAGADAAGPDGLLALAGLFRELSALGSSERRLAARVLGATLEYARAAAGRGRARTALRQGGDLGGC